MEKILIIDDFEPVRKVIKRIVEREKFIAFQACDGKEGLEVFEREHPDVIITDLKMPNIDGKGVLCAVKNQRPETEVIVLTGYGDNDMANFLIKNGAFSYLKKPLDLHQLVKILAEVRNKIRKTVNTSTAAPTLTLSPIATKELDDDISIHINSAGKIKILWEGDAREKARDFMNLGANALALPLIVINKNRNIVYSNRAFEKIAGEGIAQLDESCLFEIRSHGVSLSSPQRFFETLKLLFQNSPDDHASADVDGLGDVIIFKIFTMAGAEEIPLFILSFPILMT